MRAANWMPILGALILIVAAASFAFQGADNFALSQKTGTAVLQSKEHVPEKKTYRTDYIAGQPRVIPQYVPETYVLKLLLDGTDVSAAVSREVFDAARADEKFVITYEQGRFTRKIKVTGVRPQLTQAISSSAGKQVR